MGISRQLNKSKIRNVVNCQNLWRTLSLIKYQQIHTFSTRFTQRKWVDNAIATLPKEEERKKPWLVRAVAIGNLQKLKCSLLKVGSESFFVATYHFSQDVHTLRLHTFIAQRAQPKGKRHSSSHWPIIILINPFVLFAVNGRLRLSCGFHHLTFKSSKSSSILTLARAHFDWYTFRS